MGEQQALFIRLDQPRSQVELADEVELLREAALRRRGAPLGVINSVLRPRRRRLMQSSAGAPPATWLSCPGHVR